MVALMKRKKYLPIRRLTSKFSDIKWFCDDDLRELLTESILTQFHW